MFEALRKLFLTAFSLNFHLPLDPTAAFDANGAPKDGTAASQVGRGSLQNLCGPVASFIANPLIKKIGGKTDPDVDPLLKLEPSSATGKLPPFPWQKRFVRYQARRLAIVVGSAMLENSGTAQAFQALMLGAFPKGPIQTNKGTLAGVTTLQGVVDGLPADPAAPGALSPQVINDTYSSAFSDVPLRLNMLQAIQYVKSFTLGGATPDWVQVAFLRDIIPWAGQILYELLAKIQALLDAYSGIMQEIRDFITLIERKITTMERFVEFLISLLDTIESLAIDARLLSVDAGSDGIPGWLAQLEAAGGDKPQSGPGEFCAGVVLAYVAVDASAFKDAFATIF